MLDEYFAQCEEIDTLYEGIEQAEAEIRDANARISTLEPANEALLEQIITRRPEWAAALEDGADPRDES
jgi:predicted  nucleic acid-binding Zn-ribbon protein